MNLTLFNFLQEIKQIITGTAANTSADGGFLVDVDISKILQQLSTSSTVSGPVTTYNAIIPSTGSLSVGPFSIGRDYDQASDILQFRFTGSTSATSTDTVTSWLTSVTVPGSSSQSTLSAQVVSTAFVANYWNNFGISQAGNGLAQGDVFFLNLSTNNSPITVAGGTLTYASCLVAYDMYGNELVGTSTQEIRG